MTPRLLSFAEIVEPAFTGWSLLYLWVGLSLITALVACRAAHTLKRRPSPPVPEPDESPADELPAYPPPLPVTPPLWWIDASDDQGPLAVSLRPCGAGIALIVTDGDRTSDAVWLDRQRVQGLRESVTGWLCDTAREVRL